MCPSASCQTPLNVASNYTFSVIDDLLGEAAALFPDTFMHLGGDEVNTDCWDKTPSVATWMTDQGIDADGAYAYFVKKVAAIATSKGKRPVQVSCAPHAAVRGSHLSAAEVPARRRTLGAPPHRCPTSPRPSAHLRCRSSSHPAPSPQPSPTPSPSPSPSPAPSAAPSPSPTQWSEVYDHFKSDLPKNTIVHVWKAVTNVTEVLADGYDVLRNVGYDATSWYLDNLNINWNAVYSNEPCHDVPVRAAVSSPAPLTSDAALLPCCLRSCH